MRHPVILSAEDNRANRRIIRDLFGRNGYVVIEALDGEQAVAMAKREKPDLVLMDIQLPRLSGHDAVRQIRADPEISDIPIIAVTSHALSGDDTRSFEAGCNDYVSKPFHPRELLEKVELLLAHQDRRPQEAGKG